MRPIKLEARLPVSGNQVPFVGPALGFKLKVCPLECVNKIELHCIEWIGMGSD